LLQKHPLVATATVVAAARHSPPPQPRSLRSFNVIVFGVIVSSLALPSPPSYPPSSVIYLIVMLSCTLPSIVVRSSSFLTHFITSSPPPTLICASSSLSSSSPMSRQRFPSPHRSRGHLPFPSRNDQPPGDRRPRIGLRQQGVAVTASPRSRDSLRSDSSSDVVMPQSIVGGGAVPTVVVVVATTPATAPRPIFS
jgi:hypothetical protein